MNTTKFNDLYHEFLSIPKVATFEQEEPSNGELVTKQVGINLIVLLPNKDVIIPDYMIISLIADYDSGLGKNTTDIIHIPDDKTSLFRKILNCVEIFLHGFKKNIYVNKINLASHMIIDHLFKDEIDNCGLTVVHNISKPLPLDYYSAFKKSIMVYGPELRYIVEYDFKAQKLIFGEITSLKKKKDFPEYSEKISIDMRIEDLLFTDVVKNIVFSDECNGNPYNITPDLIIDLTDHYISLIKILIKHASRVYLNDILTNKKDDWYKFTIYENLNDKHKLVISSTAIKHPPYMTYSPEGLITYVYDICEILFISSEYKLHEPTNSWELVRPSTINQSVFSYIDINDEDIIKDFDFDTIPTRITDIAHIAPFTTEIAYIIKQIMINQIKDAIF